MDSIELAYQNGTARNGTAIEFHKYRFKSREKMEKVLLDDLDTTYYGCHKYIGG